MPVPGDCLRHRENAGIRLALSKPELQEPWEERALPSLTCLRHSVNKFLDTADARTPVGAKCCIPGWRVTVHDLVRLEVALKIGRDKVPSAQHAHARGVGDSRERTKRCWTHGGAE
eukprot:6185473-Pleurochrysis_carterae.AAC.2